MKCFTTAAVLLVAMLLAPAAQAQDCCQKTICCTHGAGCRDCAARGKSCSCDQKPNCKHRWTEWTSTTAKSKTRRVLVKYIVIKEIPSYKWVVVKPQPAGGESDVPPPPPTARLPQVLQFGTVTVPAGTKLPPLPRGITPDQIRGVVFQGDATPTTPQRRPQAAASQPRLILR